MKLIDRKILLLVGAKSNNRCFYCNTLIGAVYIDHFTSRKKWKEWRLDECPWDRKLDDLQNLFLSCRFCNSSKGAKDPDDFMDNPYIAWSRYYRANKRIGLCLEIDLTKIF